jgi:hypothetical protein
MKRREVFLMAIVAVVLYTAANYVIRSAHAQATPSIRIQKVNPRVQTNIQITPSHVVGFSCVGRPSDPGKPDEIDCFVASTN